jgi:hypothetical protein
MQAQGTARLHSLLVSTDERLSDTVTASTLRCATYRQLQHAPVPVARRLTLRGSDTLLQRVWGALCQARDALQTAARSEGAEPRPPEPSPRALGPPFRTEYVEVAKLMELVRWLHCPCRGNYILFYFYFIPIFIFVSLYARHNRPRRHVISSTLIFTSVAFPLLNPHPKDV